ncbi:hypothetical protein U0070_025786 [Myodes glareolus]|uniref:Protein kinase domain-containing protein n=1 Tax=Myodes glareolus TaxID=447135 RepID=A0AAW0J864_MYOGA
MPRMDDYTILSVIGQGSFGRALLVRQESSNQKFAMKEVRLPKSFSDTQKSRKEAVLLAKMKHPNIVAFQESFEGKYEFSQIRSYLDLILNNCDFPKESPNVFLTQSGKVKLGDFGSARLLSSPMAFACTYVGTPYYVPPEIWENLPYNNKSDIWSLGCILYELCALKHPFQANSWKNLILKICQGPIPPLPALYSDKLHCLVKQMLKRSPSQRPSATTLLCRGSLAPLILKCLPREQEEGRDRKCHHAELKSTCPNSVGSALRRAARGNTPSGSPSAQQQNATPASPPRQQWESHVPGPALAALGKAPILTSSFTAEDDRGGSVIKYSENCARQQWLKEPPETLLSMLKDADLSLAFKTYTIYRPEAASDSVDGDHDSVILDPERFEPRLDEEDTDFEEDDENPDWVSELKKHVGWKDMSDGNSLERVPEPCGGDTDAWKWGED